MLSQLQLMSFCVFLIELVFRPARCKASTERAFHSIWDVFSELRDVGIRLWDANSLRYHGTMAPSHSMAPRNPYNSGGMCIYCLKSFPKLTREHIVPEAFSGSWSIVGACACCAAKSNKEYENLVLQSDIIRTVRSF